MEKKADLLERLGAISNSQDRFGYIISEGKKWPGLKPDLKVDQTRVEGCLSKLWLVSEAKNGLCYFEADSDSAIVRAIAGLLCQFYSGSSPAEILSVPPDFLAEIGISQHLTANRRNSLAQVWNKIRVFAEAQQAKETA